MWCSSLRAGSAGIGGGIVLRAERVDGTAPVTDEGEPSSALGAEAIGVLHAIGVDS